jgi:hypothetical protein
MLRIGPISHNTSVFISGIYLNLSYFAHLKFTSARKLTPEWSISDRNILYGPTHVSLALYPTVSLVLRDHVLSSFRGKSTKQKITGKKEK